MTRFVAAFVALVVAASLVGAALTKETSVFDLGFLFGPAIQDVAAGGGLRDGSRMPLVPWFLGAIARVSPSVALALALKNLLFGLPLAKIAWDLRARRDRASIAALVYVCTFPQLVRHTVVLAPEEAHLTPLLAYVFHEALQARPAQRARQAAGVALAAALAVLTKSTMLVLAPCIAILIAVRTRSARVLAIVGGGVIVAALLWSASNLARSGTFTPASSMDGYNFWKGNNARTLEHFPFRSLDALSDAAPSIEEGESEWSWSARCYREGLLFAREHPADEARILAWRLYQVFVAVTPEQPAAGDGERAWLRYVGVGHMLVFRLLLGGSIFWSVRALWRARRSRRARPSGATGPTTPSASRAEQTRTDAGLGLTYLLFAGAFVAPYLVAWGVERRLMPLVLPTVLFVLRALHSTDGPSPVGR